MTFVASLSPEPKPDKRSWFVIHAKGLIGRLEQGRVLLLSEEQVIALGVRLEEAQSLGILDGRHAVAAPFAGALEALPPGFGALGLRALATALDEELFQVAGRAMHVVDWVTTTRFCGRCGSPTTPSAVERCRTCPACGLTQYPRIAPAVIVLVRRGREALLARNARFPGAFFSTLAGFSEIGESLEMTLVREVFEEVGIQVRAPRYFGSQPWPFPHSLMVGFTAEWASGEIRVDPSEIAEAAWFRPEALPQIPPSLSIARRLIDDWVAQVRGT